MSVYDMVLVAEKRPWVPEWLFRIAKHWLPLAEVLCQPVRCRWYCDKAATVMLTDHPDYPTESIATCDFHYDIERAKGKT